jgi:hypothetical protein
MKISLPNKLLDWREYGPLGEWLNKGLFVIGRLVIRPIDLLLVFFFFVCTGWYWYTIGWLGALQGGALYIFIAMVALFFF